MNKPIRIGLTMIGWVIAALVMPAQWASADAPRPPITGLSHIALFAADMAASERFYTHDLGAVKGEDPENPAGVRLYFSSKQFVELLPLPATGTTSPNRLDHIAFETTDAKAMRAFLASRNWPVPAAVSRSADGSQYFIVADPEGHRIEFLQAGRTGPSIPPNPLSSHIMHVGFIIHDRVLEDRFFRDLLGFRPYWYGGMRDDSPSWVSQQVPNGTDWLEYMILGPTDDQGKPQVIDRRVSGILDHFSLGVANIEASYSLLWNGDRLNGQTELPKIGRDAKWQLNLYDPDGTRAEIMELHAIGKPCCSPFTAADPQH